MWKLCRLTRAPFVRFDPDGGHSSTLGGEQDTLVQTDERLISDISFQIGRISKSELNVMKGRDCTARDAVKKRIAQRIVTRLRKSYEIESRDITARLHSTP